MATGYENLIHITSETAKELGAKGGTNKKGSKHISTWINNMLNDEDFKAMIKEGIEIKEYKGAPIKAIVGAQIRLAINGDGHAADLLFRHGTPNKLLLGNDPDNPLTDVKHMNKEELTDAIRDIVGSSTDGGGTLHKGTETSTSQN